MTEESTVPRTREFVKYANRKIHEVGSDESYVTMMEIHAAVRAGSVIKVTEDATGADLTAFTLARLVYDRARRDADAFKAEDLRRLIREGRA